MAQTKNTTNGTDLGTEIRTPTDVKMTQLMATFKIRPINYLMAKVLKIANLTTLLTTILLSYNVLNM